MCRKVSCNTCNKPTWAGCGMHIGYALKGVAEEDRCEGWRTGKCNQPPVVKKNTPNFFANMLGLSSPKEASKTVSNKGVEQDKEKQKEPDVKDGNTK